MRETIEGKRIFQGKEEKLDNRLNGDGEISYL